MRSPFWVDLYVDPDPAPRGVNQPWHALSPYGAAWGVDGSALPLAPGERLTLTLDDDYFWPEGSDLPGQFPAGSTFYVQVDSVNFVTVFGAVLEPHEASGGTYNNIAGPFVVDEVLQFSPVAVSRHPTQLSGALPGRRAK